MPQSPTISIRAGTRINKRLKGQILSGPQMDILIATCEAFLNLTAVIGSKSQLIIGDGNAILEIPNPLNGAIKAGVGIEFVVGNNGTTTIKVAGDNKDKTIQLREWDVCMEDGTMKKALFLSSEPYDA